MRTDKLMRRGRRMLTAAAFLFAFAEANAQNVFVTPQTGKLIAALTSSTEAGFQRGWNSLWKHNQLPLTITVADGGELTDAGELKIPAANLNLSENGDALVLSGGQTYDSYMVVTLPKGYRFTGYNMTLQNNMDGATFGGFTFTKMDKTFCETNSAFDKNSAMSVAKNDAGATAMTAGDKKEYTIARQSKGNGDMGNRLYFLLSRSASGFYAVTIKSFEVFFATDDFTATMSPGNLQEAVSFCEVPFLIDKFDLGEIKKNTKDGSTYYSYDYQNVKDATANNVLYQQDAVSGGLAGDFAAAKHISSQTAGGQSWFALSGDTYYAESPTSIKLSDGTTELPVGYRITGAKLKLAGKSEAGFSITMQQNGKTVYLGTDLKFSSSATVWEWEGKKIKCGDKYLNIIRDGYISPTYKIELAGSVGDGISFEVANGMLRGVYKGSIYSSDGYVTMSSDGELTLTSTSSSATASYLVREYIPDYTVKLYGTDKDNPVKTVNASDEEQTVEVGSLNNDAVKFSVEGLEGDAKALVQVELTMEYLNPYISSLDVVCHEANGQSVKQTLNTNNFEVRGGEFKFHVPEDGGSKCTFSFENLKSNYADNTYYNGERNGTSRYNFVESEYWTSGKGLKLYEGYDPNAAYETKVSTVLAGTVPFRFSNVDELENTSTSEKARQLEEYPFSLEAYRAQTKPAAGEFKQFELAVGDKGTAYLFVADETRYNIAPTTASEHRYFAYYKMDVELLKGTYTANTEFTKVYESTCYEGDKTAAMWGAKVTTVGETGENVAGNLTTAQIKAQLDGKLAGEGIEASQILYVDLSGLNSVVETEDVTFENLRDGLAPNTLVYLPKGVNAGTYNYSSQLQDGSAFYACDNIRIADKYPFFAPYGITVTAEQFVEYTRKITIDKNGKVRIATVMLPFTVSVEGSGLHTNEDGTSLSVWTMQENNFISTISPDGNPTNYNSDVHFVEYSSFTGKTEADAPYMVKVENAPGDAGSSFTIKQYGSNIEATKRGGIYSGGTSTGTLGGGAFTFTPKASYAGMKLAKAGNFFYFGQGMFLNSQNINGDYLYCYPFRAVYEYGGGAAAKTFDVAFGENQGETTGIKNVENTDASVEITPIAGGLSISARKAAELTVYDMSGVAVKRLGVAAGETQNVSLPAGIYLVNKRKVAVK